MTDTSRDQIVGIADGWLHKNVYAEAGAGTGKTSALVERIVNLLLSEEILPENIVAVTFTVAAASELRQKVREALERQRLALTQQGDTERIGRILNSIESLDSAFIGTIHSFAQSLLTERPIEAGLPPVFELVEPVQSEQNFDQAWSEWLEVALDDRDFRAAVTDLQMLGSHDPLNELHDLALEFRDDYDLVEAAIPVKASENAIDVIDHLESILSDLNQSLAYASYCKDLDDPMLNYLDEKVAPIVRLITESLESKSSSEHVIAVTQVPEFKVGKTGRGPNWRKLPGGENVLNEIRKLLVATWSSAVNAREIVGESALVLITNKIAEMTLQFADSQREAGVIDFQDLLVLSCRMLEQNSEVRADFQRRFTRVLIDEFQDTDPLQLKLAILLTSSPGKQTPDPGRLFVVGDPKQSIYRFRRADLTQLSTLVKSLKSERKNLSSNYRSHLDILDWVNDIFEPWFNTWPQETSFRVQAEYEQLRPGLKNYDRAVQPAVLMTGDDSHAIVADARDAEAEEIAKLAISIGSGAWNVTRRNGHSRKSTYRDLTILFPRRAVLPFIARELTEAGVPYVLEGQTALFESQDIRDLTSYLAAIDDPTDQVAIVASLKSVIWGFSDQDLYDWAKTGRKFDYASGIDEVNDSDSDGAFRIHSALNTFHEFHTIRHLHTTADLLELVVRDRKLREISVLMKSDESGIRLIDLFIEMSRTMQNIGIGSVREFIRWVERQTESRTKVAEGALTNSEINAVRIMTVHASKGLEFPIVAVAGLQTSSTASKNKSLIKEYSGVPEISVSLGASELGIHTANHETMKGRDSDVGDAEHARLAYVAATRARDHLILSVHRTVRQGSTLAGMISVRDSVLQSPAAKLELVDLSPVRSAAQRVGETNCEIFDWSTESEWVESTSASVKQALKRGYATPSQLATHEWETNTKPDDNSESRELDAAKRGRAATRVGSAVHQVLQDINFDDPSDIAQLVTSAIEAYELDEDPAGIELKVRNVLESASLQNVSESNSIHEAWIAAKIEPGIELEGAVDLLIKHDDDSFTIVDYKTDRVKGEELLKRAAGYEPQLGGYALVLEKLDINVRNAVLIFANGGEDGRAIEYAVPDLEGAKRLALCKARAEIG